MDSTETTNRAQGIILYQNDLKGFLSPIYRSALETGLEIKLVQTQEKSFDEVYGLIKEQAPGFVIISYQSFKQNYFPSQDDFMDHLKEEYPDWPYTILAHNLEDEAECRKLSAEDFLPIPYPQTLLDAIFRRLKSESIQIMVIENDLVQRTLLATKLKDNGFHVIECKNAEDALESVQNQFPDLIISDINLDEMNGMQFCEALKANPYSASIPILMISASADLDTIMEGLKKGASDYITKPFEFFELEQKIRFYLEKSFRRRKLVLVIDDSRLSRELAKAPLKAEGYRVILAENGREGLQMALDREPDLIITDYNMPLMDGYTLCRNLKADPRTRKIPIIMVTGRDSELDRKVGRTLKIHDYITKPFLPQNLVNTANMALLERMMEEERAVREIYENELEVGRNIQASLMPAEFENLPEGLELAGGNIPAKHLGGDFYDDLSFEQDPDLIGLVVADVSGKGLPAALVAVNCQSSLKAISYYDTDVSRLMGNLNQVICKSTNDETFVTIFLLTLDLKKKELKYACAGHKGMLLYSKERGELQDLSLSGLPAGILEEVEYPLGTMNFSNGDFIILFTDGIVEALGPNKEHYGEERLHDLIKQTASKDEMTAKILHQSILDDVKSFTRGAAQSDDITLFIAGINDQS